MSDSKNSKTTNKNTKKELTVREIELRDKIVDQAKRIARMETSSAFDLIQETKELLKLESELK